MSDKILFILKQRKGSGSDYSYDGYSYEYDDYNTYGEYGEYVDEYGDEYSYGYYPSTGLLNEATMASAMLTSLGIENKVVQVMDNNRIDKEVHDYKPTVVILEALWVIPEKFLVLARLHPKVKWIIRLHSNTPFLANEGIAFQWINGYLNYPSVHVATNNKKMLNELQSLSKG